MGQRHDSFDFITYFFGVKRLQPEQTARTVFNQVIAADHLSALSMDL